jgi:hypothetical protein
MTLRQTIVLYACRETLDRAKRAAWWRHCELTAGTDDARAIAYEARGRANAAVDAMVHLIQTIVDNAWRERADDATVTRFLTWFRAYATAATIDDVMARALRQSHQR